MLTLLLLLQDPADLLRDVHRHMERAERELNDGKLVPSTESQQRAIDAINELIRNAPRNDSPSSTSRPSPSSNPAVRPPTPVEPVDLSLRFAGDGRTGPWGLLPARIREAIHHDARALDDFPAEYRDLIGQYHRRLMSEPPPR